MPAWLGKVLAWGFKVVLPYLKDWIERWADRVRIDREVNEETLEIEQIKKQIKEYQEKNKTDEIPPHLQRKLDSAARKRVRGLQ